MVVKAGPKAFWHCQPDNGTFELWFNGKNLFPDSLVRLCRRGRSDGGAQLAPSDRCTQHGDTEQSQS
ncbi:heparinase III protein [Bacteroides pyogenes DSM 20611 = JCM 6294]|nr:heparinase III protein [Bacteroides pyogenes DSM 20611 = JCM 6294]